MVKAKDLRDQTVEELQKMERAALSELFEMVNRAHIEKPEKPHLIGSKRKEIARLKTVIREKQLAS